MNQHPKIYYVFSGRFPSEKAHALYIAKVFDAFQSQGHSMTIIVPKRKSIKADPQTFFGTKNPLNVKYIPTLDLFGSKVPLRVAFLLNYFCFSIGVFFWFLLTVPKDAIIFSNESLPCLLLAYAGRKVIYEMHDYPESYKGFFSVLCRRVSKVLTQNKWKKEKLIETFKIPEEKIIVEPNGVEIEEFDIHISQQEAREKLRLQDDLFLVVYTGNLFDWKGADILAQAAHFLSEKEYQVIFVGGNSKNTQLFQNKYGSAKSIRVIGHRPHMEIPLWQKAADCLVIPNTGKMNISKYYTSPMKLFEYMASGVPIVASDLPSIRAVASKQMVAFFQPDDPSALHTLIQDVKNKPEVYKPKAERARIAVEQYTWKHRAERILKACFI